jgi:CHRD domain
MNKLLVLAIASILSATFASTILAKTTVFTADLKGTSQVPPIESAATGKAEVTYDDASKMLTWTITYSGLSGNVTAAHFHGPAKAGENAGPMVPITQLDSPMKGSATLTEDQSQALTGGKMYVNVHTAKYPDGEIRGQLAPAK